MGNLSQGRMPVRPFEILYDAADLYKSDLTIDSAEDGFRVSLCVFCNQAALVLMVYYSFCLYR